MQILNLTPHTLNVQTVGGEFVELPPTGTVPRVSQTRECVGEVNGIALNATSFGEVEGLPEQQEGVLLVVSALVRNALPSRTDLASPGMLIRNEDGQPVGCDGLDVNF